MRFLKEHPLLSQIHPTHLDELQRVSQEVTLKKGEFLFHLFCKNRNG